MASMRLFSRSISELRLEFIMDKNQRSYDQFLVLIVGCLAVLHYIAWSDYPPDVDPINFTVALQHFAPAFDSPHPPGYPLFVFAARLAAVWVGDNHAYQFINLSMALGSGGFLYILFRRLNETAIGFASVLLLMSHPLVWSATVIPECYISDVFFGTAILALVLTQRASKQYLIVGIFVLFLLLGLVRPVSGVMLLPLAIVGSYITSRSKSLPLILAIIAAVAVVLAYGITAYLSGGLTLYRSAALRVMGGAFRASSILGGAPLSAHLKMLSHLLGWWLLLAIPATVALFFSAWKNPSSLNIKRQASALVIGAAWLLPPLAFYGGIYYLKPTYQLIYLPCLLIPVAWVLYGKESRVSRASANYILSFLVIGQLVIFFLPIPKLPQALHRYTEAFVIQQDKAWEQLLDQLNTLPKQNTLLIWVSHPSLPFYTVRLLDWEAPIAVAKQARTKLSYVEPKTMTWSPDNDKTTRIDNHYEGVVTIDEREGQAIIRYVRLSNEQDHEVEYLLKQPYQ